MYIIDGRKQAKELRQKLVISVQEFINSHGLPPKLAVILVGGDARSLVYVRAKQKAIAEVGMETEDYFLPQETTEQELLDLIRGLNARSEVHGILVQLPLPNPIKTQTIFETLDPHKDVDGFHPLNVGLLMLGIPRVVPCTPLGCLMLLRSVVGDLSGQHSLVIGRSQIVGRPLSALLLSHNCTVTIAHSRTKNLKDLCRSVDIVICAVGVAGLIRGDWLSRGAVVIDVGITSVPQNQGQGKRLVGDVVFSEAQHVRAITPVPGGVGPMTVACLLVNTLRAAYRQQQEMVPQHIIGYM